MLVAAFFCLIAVMLIFGQIPARAGAPTVEINRGIIPAPKMIKSVADRFHLNRRTRLVINDKAARGVARYFQKFIIPATGFYLKISHIDKPQQGAINLFIAKDFASPEAYTLSVRTNRVIIRAASKKGLFYGLQSLRQLLPPEIESHYPFNDIDWAVAGVEIKDGPLYPFRAMHLDVSRHFFSKDFILRYIDLMALYKMNVFHWHLTDDQGWRIEIKKYPRLTTVGAYRPETVIGHPYDRVHYYDGRPVTGFYSQQDIRQIVKYAADRQVTIIPEIDVPGHTSALLAAYPEYGCIRKAYKVKTEFHIFPDVMCPTEKSFRFLKDIFTEVAALFPGPYIHIGGDEVMKEQWKACKSCTLLMRKEGLKNYNELQGYFVRRVQKIINGLGKRMAGCEEILQGGINPGAVITVWLKRGDIIKAIRAGDDVVVGMSDKLYFNQYESLSLDEPMASSWQPPISLQDVYQYNLVPDGLSKKQRAHILGAQGHVWTNFITTPAGVEQAALPRMSALAEILWTPANKRSWPDFLSRTGHFFRRLDIMAVKASRAVYKVRATHRLKGRVMTLILHTEGKNHVIRYTRDGSRPNAHSPLYTGPLILAKPVTIRAVGQDPKRGRIYGDFRLTFVPHKALGKKISFTYKPRDFYQLGPKKTILDGVVAYDRIFHPMEWAEFHGVNLDGIIDFGKKTDFHSVSMGIDAGQYRRLFRPQSVEILISDDGRNWQSVKKVGANTIRAQDPFLVIEFPKVSARYLRVIGENNRKVFNSRLGKKVPVSIFIDEIIVN
ncbi:MAG: family 20 glycosylhydrolase [Alphaproteobacteria bacterium]|nr:family 20 glycosylhydrolase [Alphaproteobacteria bacterium]